MTVGQGLYHPFPPSCVVSLEPGGLAVGPYWESVKGEIVTRQQSNKISYCQENITVLHFDPPSSVKKIH